MKVITVYILSHKFFTGGPNSLHQLGSLLQKKGLDVRMVYTNPSLKLPDRLAVYNIPIVDSVSDISDTPENVFIVPEDSIDYLDSFKNIKKCIWWLSLHYYLIKLDRDYFIHDVIPKFPKSLYILPRLYLRIKRGRHQKYYIPQPDDGIFHLYNCEYVRQYLEDCGVPSANMCYSCGPIESIYHQPNDISIKENIVLYNPKKGYEFTKKILSRLNKLGVKTIPIQNLTAPEIKSLMDRSKVYIDFGFFPGYERIPREAVISNCTILTSRTGAAANNVDIPIPDDFKIESKDENIDIIINKIEYMLDHYSEILPIYESFRIKVKMESTFLDNGADTFIKFMHLHSQE